MAAIVRSVPPEARKRAYASEQTDVGSAPIFHHREARPFYARVPHAESLGPWVFKPQYVPFRRFEPSPGLPIPYSNRKETACPN